MRLVIDTNVLVSGLRAHCPLVTGNLRHFPLAGAVTVLTPREASLLLSSAGKAGGDP